jgi:20S proteasome alpha/beta subunit
MSLSFDNIFNLMNFYHCYRSDYGSPIPLPYLTQRVSAYMHAYTLYSSIRPFGATVILGSWDKQVPSLFLFLFFCARMPLFLFIFPILHTFIQ